MHHEAELIRFLLTDPAAAPNEQIHGGPDAVVHETHTSIVVATGQHAYKLKRSIRLPYLDFSTPKLREQVCQRELELNRRTAPDLYLAAPRITRGPQGHLALDGPGSHEDTVVLMRRFAGSDVLDSLARQGRLTPALMTPLARLLAAFHASAKVSDDAEGAARVLAILDLNAQSEAGTAEILGNPQALKLGRTLRDQWTRHAKLLDERARAGKVRLCHGDLHLGNICVWEGKAVPFDCLEFDETLATTDVLYDLAFLLMDLWRYDECRLANLVMNRYMDETGDIDGLPLLPFFIALRAAIRAQVLATQANITDDTLHADRCRHQANQFLALAFDVLTPRPTRLIAIGGLSGTGKSSLAINLAHAVGPVPGARVLSSDRIRKQLAGVPAEHPLPPHSYTPEASRRVYQEQAQRSTRVLKNGYAVIADAVFSKPEERATIQACATREGVPFTGLWLDASQDTLMHRVQARVNDPSDATIDVVRRQLQYDTGVLDWTLISAENTPEGVAHEAHAVLQQARLRQCTPPGDRQQDSR